MSLASALGSRAARGSFVLLPLFTSLDAASRLIPPAVFYPVLGAYALALGLMFLRALGSDQQNCRAVFLPLMLTVLSLALIVPLSVPGNVLDNQPSMPTTVQLSLQTVSAGSVPSPTSATLSYLDYPGSVLTLSAGLLVTGMQYISLAKFLSVFLPLCVPLAFFGLLGDKRVALVAAAIAGFSPWIFLEGAHYYSASLAGILFAFSLACVFSTFSEKGRGKQFAVLGGLTLALTVTDPYFSFMWSVLLLCLLLALLVQRSNRHAVRNVSLLLPISAGVWITWYFLTLAGFQVTKYLGIAFERIFEEPSASPQYLLPSQVKPTWFYGVEYATFLSLAVLSVLSILLLRRVQPRILASIESASVTSAVSFVPFLLGFTLLADLAMRSLFIFQIGSALAIGWVLAGVASRPGGGLRLRLGSSTLRKLAVVLFTVLLVFNALTYGIEAYRYDSTTAYANKDTRFNLEAWQGLGEAICSHTDSESIWGVSLGGIFTKCSWNAVAFANGAGVYELLPYELSNLTASVGSGSLVIVRLSMQQVPEWSQPLPENLSAILHGYDLVLTTGDPVLVYT